MTAYDPQRAAQQHADSQAREAGGLFADLASGPPLASRFDAEPSKDAADMIATGLSELQARVLTAFRYHGAMTARQAEELPEFSTLGFSTVRKRICELAKLGQLVDCGKADRMTLYRARRAHEAAA